MGLQSTNMEDNTSPQPSLETPPQFDFKCQFNHHWNDPPKKIFHKANTGEDDDFNVEQFKAHLTEIVDTCKETFKTGPNKRITDDTSKRIQSLIKDVENDDVESNVVIAINDLCKNLKEKDWEKATDIHRQLMTTEYERHGSWLLGLKRLIDLYEKTSSS
ncbi:unnamed protein product [Cunninghamella blakesleeana]